jgi:predicted MFS family arabinose efflux permease
VASGFVWLAVARVALGVASGVGIVAIVTDSLERFAPAKRGLVSAISWAGAGLGLLISAPAGAWSLGDPARWRVATLLAAVPALLLVMLALRLRPHVVVTQAAAGAADAPPFAWHHVILSRHLFFVVAYGAYGMAYISYATFSIAAFAARGLPPVLVSAVWAVFGAAAVIGVFGIVPLLRSRYARFTFAVPFVTSAAGCAISSLGGPVSPVAGALCVGIGLCAVPAVASAYSRMRSDPATAAVAFTAVTTVFGVAQLLGPLVSGAVADRLGLDAVPVFAAAVFAFGAISAAIDALLPRRRAA